MKIASCHWPSQACWRSSASARAERFDCSLFRGAQAQFACYDNLSRAPKAEPKEAIEAGTPPSQTRLPRGHRKPRADYSAHSGSTPLALTSCAHFFSSLSMKAP